MRGGAARGYLRQVGSLWRDLLFRSIVCATLVNVALVFAIYAPDPTTNHSADRHSERDRIRPPIASEKTPEERTADYTCWLTAETFVLAISTVGLWVVTWRGARGQARDMKRSLNIAESTAERQLRAYLVIEPDIFIDQESGPGASFEARPVLVNAGQTPAYDVIANSRMRVLPFPIGPEFTFPLDIPSDPSIRVLGPDQRTGLICNLGYIATPEDLRSIKSRGPVRLIAYGVVTYRDVFGKTHTTRYGFFFQWGSKGIPIWFSTNLHNQAT